MAAVEPTGPLLVETGESPLVERLNDIHFDIQVFNIHDTVSKLPWEIGFFARCMIGRLIGFHRKIACEVKHLVFSVFVNYIQIMSITFFTLVLLKVTYADRRNGHLNLTFCTTLKFYQKKGSLWNIQIRILEEITISAKKVMI